LNFIRSIEKARRTAAQYTAGFPHIESAVEQSGLLARLDLPSYRSDILLIQVEGLGVFRDSTEQELLLKTLRSAARVEGLNFVAGEVPYHGSTNDGILRELCQLEGSYSRLQTVEARICIPQRLRRRGYSTTAYHGFSSRLFDRASWFPWLGFEGIEFEEQLIGEGEAEHCGGVLYGLCDDRLVARVVRESSSTATSPRFVYLLTLNSHVPFVVPQGRKYPFACSTEHAPDLDETVCDLLNIWIVLFDAVARELQRFRDVPVDILLVGDHAPPLFKLSSRSRFKEGLVSWMLLSREVSSPRPTSSRVAEDRSSDSNEDSAQARPEIRSTGLSSRRRSEYSVRAKDSRKGIR
jgi:hypothetical protein